MRCWWRAVPRLQVVPTQMRGDFARTPIHV
ncbi:hypothetical protein GQ600_7528 [Phytophthora cactorum]|nr:hypothetical protein GQ600_7528 [Phytophthora cactorum]